MNNDIKEFVELRDSLYVAMTEAAQEEVASSSIDADYIVAALLAAHVACCHTVLEMVPSQFRERWLQELLKGLTKTGGQKSAYTMH